MNMQVPSEVMEKGKKRVVELWGNAAVSAGKGAVNAFLFVRGLPTKMAVFLLACFCLVVFGIILYLVIYCVRYLYPRIPLPNHSARADSYAKGYIKEMMQLMQDIDDGLKTDGGRMQGEGAFLWDVMPTQAQDLQTLIRKLNKRDLESDIMAHILFRKQLAKMNFIARGDLRNNSEFYSDGDLDQDKIDDFALNMTRPYNKMAKAVGDISRHFEDAPEDAPRTVEAYRFISHVHQMRLLFRYEDDLTFMFQSRRKKMPFAIWTVYYAPYVEDIFKHRIPQLWAKTGNRYVKCMKDALNWWINLGIKLGLMTCNLAFTDPVERAEKCRVRDWSKGGKEETFAAEGGGGAKEDVVEGAGFVSALSSIVTFLRNIEYIGIAIYRFGKNFPNDPLGTIMGILSLIIGTIFGLVFMILYLWLTFTAIFWIFMFLYGVIVTFVTAILITLYHVLMAVLISVPYFVMWLIDMPTKGMITKLLRCENLPDAWTDTPTFVEGNGYMRNFFCFGRCSPRYTASGCLCKRRKGHLPDYCPQQQIYRLTHGMTLMEPYAFEKFRSYPGFANKSLQSKQKIIVRAYRDKMTWYQKCHASLRTYRFITKHACHFADVNTDLSEFQRRRLKLLCRECYCDYRPDGNWLTGIVATMTSEEERNSPMCVRLRADEAPPPSDGSGLSGPAVELLKKTLLLSMLAITLLVMFYSMLQASKHMLEAVKDSS
jgi:hypothetical protein